MDVQRIIGRFGRRLLWCTLGAMLALSPGTALAQAGGSTDACGQSGDIVEGSVCQNQPQAAVGYSGSQTLGWAYYCNDPNGAYIYFWADTNGIAWNNTCFTEAENELLESGSKSDANYTNWCISGQSLTVVLACWDQPNPYID